MAQTMTGRATAEGDEIYYEIRGQGQPLLMIPGGVGDAGVYSFVADILADEFKVIAYDRRGQSRSTRRDPQNFEIGQQARDAVAVLKAAGENAAIVFGSSSGAVIGFEMARSHPQAMKALIAHEPPVVRILPDADKWLSIFAELYLTTLREGAQKGMRDFLAFLAIPPAAPDPELLGSPVFQEINQRQTASSSSEFGLRNELLPSSHYEPDFSAIRKNGVKVLVGVGRITLDTGSFFGRTVPILAERLGCETIVFPGHHGSYTVNPRSWAATLRDVLHRV